MLGMSWCLVLLMLAYFLAASWASLDFLISHDGHTFERTLVNVMDWQTPCLTKDPVQEDVLLECTLSGPDGWKYREHCTWSDVLYKVIE